MVTFYVTLVFIYNTHEHTLTYEFLDIKLVKFKVLSIIYTKSRESDYIPDFYKVFFKACIYMHKTFLESSQRLRLRSG